ncbi:MAG: putative hydrophobic protein (TIGR00271 family) [Flavobacteriales bacterium]|jgi:uncharacterized hydrophobic protein (TIGR00271 family)
MNEDAQNPPEDATKDPMGEELKAKEIEDSKSNVKWTFALFIRNVKIYLTRILSLREGIDKEGTSEGIRQDVEFRGHAVWILIFSILIASIGLSVGNIPIIIGAMLISPLMGPILGVGLAAGTNDFDLLKKSLINFGTAVVIAIIISTVYFSIVPTPEINLELKDRKSATLLAIAVAFFGGAAGIIAGSKSLKSNVVPGVAIATALMPPLCTVGFGLATLQWDYFLGALYLFFINSVFIALPTYLYIRYLRFPVKEFIDPKREKRIKRYISIFLITTILPSAFIFYSVLKQSFFSRNAQRFLTKVELSLEGKGTTIISDKIIYDAENPMIKLALMGDPISADLRASWDQFQIEEGLHNCFLDIRQPKDFTLEIESVREENRLNSSQQIEAFYRTQIQDREAEIRMLRDKLFISDRESGEFEALSSEVKMLFPEIRKAAFAYLCETNFSHNPDTIPTLMVEWPKDMETAELVKSEAQLSRWLQVRLKNEKARAIRYNIERQIKK